MKAAVLATAAAMVAGGVSAAGSHGHRHAHRALFEKKGLDSADGICTPGCTTIYTTITGEATRMWPAREPIGNGKWGGGRLKQR
jgi:hypothetical protein